MIVLKSFEVVSSWVYPKPFWPQITFITLAGVALGDTVSKFLVPVVL